MNLKDLAQLDVKDLQNLDYKAILEELKKRPDVIVEILIVVIAVVFCIFFYQTKKDDLKTMSNELRMIEEKVVVYDEMVRIQTALNSLKSSLPDTISERQLIELITKTAERYDVSINSFSPAKQVDQAAYAEISLTINITTPSYEDLWKFIYDLEHNTKTLRLDNWSSSQGQRGGGRFNPRSNFNIQNTTTETTAMPSTITLTVFNFKK